MLAHLDQPVGPCTLCGDLEDGVRVGIAGVALEYIFSGRFVPVDHHGAGVQVPERKVLSVGSETGCNTSVEGLNLRGILALVNSLSPVRNSVELSATISGGSLVAVGGLGGDRS